MIRLGPEHAVSMPWKNGRGRTLELASDAESGAGWTWRLSLADVAESGPFSLFPGCDRLIALVDGDSMRLRTIDRFAPIPREGPAFAFSGDHPADGVLDGGPCRDINLIVRRDRWKPSLALRRGLAKAALKGEVVLVHALGGRVRVEDHASIGGIELELDAGSTCLARDARLSVVGEGVIALATLRSA